MTKDEALKLALEALEWCQGGEPCGTAEAIAAIKEALAQPPLPVQRQPLTNEQIEVLFKGVDSEDKGRFTIVKGFARAIEAAHNIGAKP
jgi:hypothetical protein